MARVRTGLGEARSGQNRRLALDPQSKPVYGLTSSNSLELSMEEARRGFRVAFVVLVYILFEFCLDHMGHFWTVEGFDDLECRAEGGAGRAKSGRVATGAEGALPGSSPEVVLDDDYDDREKWRAGGQGASGVIKSIHVEPFQIEDRIPLRLAPRHGAAMLRSSWSVCRESGSSEWGRALKRDRKGGSIRGAAKKEEGKGRQQA
jgi:hypothetical protein